jgi:hypothetical protein
MREEPGQRISNFGHLQVFDALINTSRDRENYAQWVLHLFGRAVAERAGARRTPAVGEWARQSARQLEEILSR